MAPGTPVESSPPYSSSRALPPETRRYRAQAQASPSFSGRAPVTSARRVPGWIEHVPAYDAFLLLSFGGPEGPDDVLPFLENVTRGRGVPVERLAEVAEHYYAVGGVSPINGQCRDLLANIRAAGLDLPMYWGNRNWHPFLEDTVRELAD